MATLQKLRNAGPLLLIFVGLALLAFIAGDALRIFQTPQGSQSVGEVNGEEISAVEFQDLYERQSNIYKMLRGGSNFTETEQNQIKDEVWGNYLRGKIINKEAEKLGLTVTVAELKEAVQRGEDPIFQQIPIFNNEQGKFDFDNLNMAVLCSSIRHRLSCRQQTTQWTHPALQDGSTVMTCRYSCGRILLCDNG